MKREDLILEITKVLKDRNVITEIRSCQFEKKPVVLKHLKGVYIIYDRRTGVIVYVGKSDNNIYGRIDPPHWNKATGIWEGKDSTGGWNYLRENYAYDVKDWEIIFVELPLYKKRTSVEGLLIDNLDPVANDEIFLDMLITKEKVA
jgi:hypothetical protein